MSLVSLLRPAGENGFGYGSTAEGVTAGLDLTGKTILITGCASGLGLESARVLMLRGARVLGTARTVGKARAAHGAAPPTSFSPLACDLAEPASVRACVAELRALGVRLDAIICNAGVMALPTLQLAHGWELQFFTNHIGHFLLVTNLVDVLSDAGRVVMLSSDAHRRAPPGGIDFDNLRGERGYHPWRAYGRSKIANLLFARSLAKRFAGTARTANAVHPGVIQTDLQRHMGRIVNIGFSLVTPLVMKNVAEGAATQCYVAVHPQAAGINGQYFADCNVARSRADADDAALAARLWAKSEEIVAALP